MLNEKDLELADNIATCSMCGLDFDELEINMIDYELDLCQKCEKEYVKTMNNNTEVFSFHSGIYKFELPYLAYNLVKDKDGIVPIGSCDIEIHVGDHRDLDNEYLATVIISTKPEGNAVTNDVENIASIVFNGYIKDQVIKADNDFLVDKIRWIERVDYPKEKFDLVRMEWNNENQRFISPDWYKLSDDDWILENHRLQPYK